MRRLLVIPILILAVGCRDGGITDPMGEPLATPEQADSLARGAWRGYWAANQYGWGSLGWSTAADELTSGWSGWGMRVVGAEPREAWDDAPEARWGNITREPWTLAHRCAFDAAVAVQSAASARTELFGRLALGLCLGTLAMRFDEAFVVTDESDLVALRLSPMPYPDVLRAALEQLQKVIDCAGGSSAAYPRDEEWIFGLELDAETLARLAHSFSARFLAASARSPAERQSADWPRIIEHIDNGITADFAPVGDDDGGTEWSAFHFWGNVPGRTRVDYRTMGPADESGAYRVWLEAPLEARVAFVVVTSDRRIVGRAGGEEAGSYFAFVGGESPWPESRGVYQSSHYVHRRWRTFAETSNGPMPHLVRAEMALLKAEGLLRTGGSLQIVVDLINETRVAIGRLPSASPNDPLGEPTDGSWQHRSIHLASASLWAKLQHEFRLETFATAGALAWATDRGWGDLVEGTPSSLPPPDRSVAYAFGR